MATSGSSETSTLLGIRPARVSPDLIPEVRDNTVLAGMVDWHDSNGAASVAVGRIAGTSPSATAITNGADELDAVTPSVITTAAATFTPAAKAVFILMSTVAIKTSAPDLVAASRGLVARALATKLDVDVATAFALPANSVGSTGVPLTLNDTLDAATTLQINAGSRADGNAVYVLHPVQVKHLEQDAMSRNAPWIAARQLADFFPAASDAMRRNFVGMLNGFPVIRSSNVQLANGVADRNGILAVVPSASGPGAYLGGAMVSIEEMSEDSQSMNFRVAQSMGGVSIYALGEAKDEFGVAIISDA